MINRRYFSAAACATLIGTFVEARLRSAAAGIMDQSLGDEVKHLEAGSGGRLGVAVLDTQTGMHFGYRADEQFPMCSTFKMLLAAAVLARVDAGQEQLARRIVFGTADLAEYSPRTKPRVGGDGMSVAELCEAAVTLSDNTAANLLLVTMGGPEGLTAFARKIGDPLTRLDRNEPTLNEALPGDPRDTTTPNAMVADLQTLVLGQALSAASREQLKAWLIANKTGDTRLRAGLPKDWRVGDKTGTGERGSANDIAVIWPPDRAPVIVVVYLTAATVPAAKQNATIESVARGIAKSIAG